MKHFEMTDLRLSSSYVGIDVRQGKTHIILRQRAHTKRILESFKMNECNLARTSMETRLKLKKDGGGKVVDSTKFRSLIGSLRYLIHSPI